MRTLSISGKCSDMCFSVLTLGDQKIEKDGYVPRDLGVGGGDYIEFTVDLDTGTILNWKVPTDEEAVESIKPSY